MADLEDWVVLDTLSGKFETWRIVYQEDSRAFETWLHVNQKEKAPPDIPVLPAAAGSVAEATSGTERRTSWRLGSLTCAGDRLRAITAYKSYVTSSQAFWLSYKFVLFPREFSLHAEPAGLPSCSRVSSLHHAGHAGLPSFKFIR